MIYVNGYQSNTETAADELMTFRGLVRNRSGFSIVKSDNTEWLGSGRRYELRHSAHGPLGSVEIGEPQDNRCCEICGYNTCGCFGRKHGVNPVDWD
jgi:hypothetical protein